ncbi:MAG: hypothetical protein ACRDZ2_02665 [Ilumatobacteraceae bacterium]
MRPFHLDRARREVAAVIAFLLSADASYLTALNVEIVGGSA